VSEVSYKALGDAVERLREALVLLRAHPANDLHVTMRNSVVISFRFTYELAGAMLRRFLQAQMTTRGDASEMTLPTLIRVASEHGMLLHDWERWFEYRKARNTVAHAYDEERAKLTVEMAPLFLEDAEFLFRRLTEEAE
jgi:nucleotidyltransferase substrate binding protein (TIGR01987 family)